MSDFGRSETFTEDDMADSTAIARRYPAKQMIVIDKMGGKNLYIWQRKE